MGIPGMRVLETARPAQELNADTYKIRCLSVSEGSGDGKTKSAGTIFGKKLLIDIDNRSETLAGDPNVHIIKIVEQDVKNPNAWDQMVKLKEELWKATEMDPYPYDSIIVDGLTEMFRICMYWVLNMDAKKSAFGIAESPAEQHYGPQMKHVADWIRSVQGLPVHLVITAHEEVKEYKKTGKVIVAPLATGKLRIEIPKWFNETYYNVRERDKDGKVKFSWFTQMFDNHNYLKSSMNDMQLYWDDPIPLDFQKKAIDPEHPHLVGFPYLWQKRFGVAGPTLPERGDEIKKKLQQEVTNQLYGKPHNL